MRYVKTQLSCIPFIMLTTTCFDHCGPSSSQVHLYYDHTLYSFPLYAFLWPEDGPVAETCRQHNKWDKRQLCFGLPHPLPNCRNLSKKRQGWLNPPEKLVSSLEQKNLGNSKHIQVSGFCHKLDENCAPLGYNTVSFGNFLPTFQDKLQVPSLGVKNQYPVP